MCGGYQYVERCQGRKSNNYLMSFIIQTDIDKKEKIEMKKKLSAY